jgi:hypothetical protein
MSTQHRAPCPKRKNRECYFCCKQDGVLYCGISHEKYKLDGHNYIENHVEKMKSCPMETKKKR